MRNLFARALRRLADKIGGPQEIKFHIHYDESHILKVVKRDLENNGKLRELHRANSHESDHASISNEGISGRAAS
jgi:hypothetical protein